MNRSRPTIREKCRCTRCLEQWWNEGFELTYCRKPVPDDFIVPNRHPRSRGRGAHTKSSAYKAMATACEVVGVRFEGCHLTRHTMITWARRGGARGEVLERVTHNATGAIIDQYTHFDWEPLCEAVLCLDYGPQRLALAEVPSAQQTLAPAVALAETQTAANLAAVHVASHVVPTEAGQKHERFQWRRRELKPAPSRFSIFLNLAAAVDSGWSRRSPVRIVSGFCGLDPVSRVSQIEPLLGYRTEADQQREHAIAAPRRRGARGVTRRGLL